MNNILESLCFWCPEQPKEEVQQMTFEGIQRGLDSPKNEFGAPIGWSMPSGSCPNSIEDQDPNTSTFGKYSSGDGKKNLNDPQPA
jgi:hypothetical protein